ncbi:MAG: hypothetical protein AB7I48_15730 [Planctomycetaceae bacterium]
MVDAAVPHEFAVADAELRTVLESERERFDPPSLSNMCRLFSDDVRPGVERYVDELSRIKDGRAELLRRAMLLRTMTAEGTEFDDAWNELRPSVIRWRDRLQRFYPEELRQFWGSQVPRQVSNVAEFSDLPCDLNRLEGLIKSLNLLLQRPRICEERLRRMQSAARTVKNEAHRHETEGCRLLLLWGCDLSPETADDSLREFPESCLVHEAARHISQWTADRTLEDMKAAAASLLAWAAVANHPRSNVRQQGPGTRRQANC